MSELLNVEAITAGYGDAIVLEDLSLRLDQGDSLALLGRNGMGKTTLLSTLMGVTKLHKGRMQFNGADLGALPAHVRAHAGLGWVPQERDIFPSLSVEENLTAASYAATHGSRAQFELVYEYFPFLREMRRRPAGVLSGGQLQMLVIGMAIMMRPRALLLDEPSLGLSPVMTNAVFDVVERLCREAHYSVVVAEQTVPRLLKMASDVYVMSRGTVVIHDSPQALSEEALHHVYLN